MASVEFQTWEDQSGRSCRLTTLKTASGYRMDVLDYGATVTRLLVPDRHGQFSDIVLGYDDLESYENGTFFLGATIGRVGNRIARGGFELDGEHYELALTDPPHHLHGGRLGWDKRLWSSSAAQSADEASVTLRYQSVDGEEGYPGSVDAQTVYTLSEQGLLRIEMTARCDRLTPVNMVHHSYFNLAGHDAGSIEDHELSLYCDEYTPGIVSDGSVSKVDGSVFDLRTPRRLGEVIGATTGNPKGLDQNLIVRGQASKLRPVARLFDPDSGRVMTLSANQPGLQVYTGNYLDGASGGKGTVHRQHGAICLETQAIPNAINVPRFRDQVLLKPGENYEHVMVMQFGVA